MSKTLALSEYNKRASQSLTLKELEVIEGMRSFPKEKIAAAFSTLCNKDVGLKDVELLLLILSLIDAMTPQLTLNKILPGNSSPVWPRHPYVVGDGPFRSSFNALDGIGYAVDL